jgi:hypothetical protein
VKEWRRVTDDPDVFGVSASPDDGNVADGWHVWVNAMEFVREEPLEGELRRRIAGALRSVAGVEMAEELDREVWVVTGARSGEALIRAVGAVVDDLADRIRSSYSAG